MKLYIFVFVALMATLALLSTTSEARNETWGHRGRYDMLLHRELVVASGSWLRVISRDVIYPPKNFINYYNITSISAIDRDRFNGGYPSLRGGGIGKRNATVHLTSQRGYGLNFTVEMYGRYN